MFSLGDYVVNATNGICSIKDIVELDMSGEKVLKSYFLLVPVGEENSKVFIPVDNADKRIRHIINADEAKRVIDKVEDVEEIVVPNEKERELTYKNAIKSCEPEQLVAILKTLNHRKNDRLAAGKKCTAVDERYLKMASNHLFAELAFVLDKSKEEVDQLLGIK